MSEENNKVGLTSIEVIMGFIEDGNGDNPDLINALSDIISMTSQLAARKKLLDQAVSFIHKTNLYTDEIAKWCGDIKAIEMFNDHVASSETQLTNRVLYTDNVSDFFRLVSGSKNSGFDRRASERTSFDAGVPGSVIASNVVFLKH